MSQVNYVKEIDRMKVDLYTLYKHAAPSEQKNRVIQDKFDDVGLLCMKNSNRLHFNGKIDQELITETFVEFGVLVSLVQQATMTNKVAQVALESAARVLEHLQTETVETI